MYQFDEVVERRGTLSKKWDPQTLEEMFGNQEALPLWVADMDFRVPPEVINHLKQAVEHGIYGYSMGEQANQAFASWVERRHHWTIKSEWIVNTPGVVVGLNNAIQVFTQPGDQVLIQQPVYPPFYHSIINNGRQVANNPLIRQGDQYQIDFEHFETLVKDPLTRLFILCSPHNPLGRIYTPDELKRMFDICFKYDVQVIVDEIHNDIIMPGYEFTTIGQLGEAYYQRIITCMAPSKSFNIAGLQWSAMVIPDEGIRQKFSRHLEQMGIRLCNPLSFVGVEAAYQYGDSWLDTLIVYLNDNYHYMKERLAQSLPSLEVLELQATYLSILDFSNYLLDEATLEDLIYRKAGVALNAGVWFGEAGEGLMRINLACPRATLEEALNRLIEALTPFENKA